MSDLRNVNAVDTIQVVNINELFFCAIRNVGSQYRIMWITGIRVLRYERDALIVMAGFRVHIALFTVGTIIIYSIFYSAVSGVVELYGMVDLWNLKKH